MAPPDGVPSVLVFGGFEQQSSDSVKRRTIQCATVLITTARRIEAIERACWDVGAAVSTGCGERPLDDRVTERARKKRVGVGKGAPRVLAEIDLLRRGIMRRRRTHLVQEGVQERTRGTLLHAMSIHSASIHSAASAHRSARGAQVRMMDAAPSGDGRHRSLGGVLFMRGPSCIGGAARSDRAASDRDVPCVNGNSFRVASVHT